MPKIGIVCDNYKVEEFKKEFKSRNIACVVNPYNNKLTAIMFYCSEETGKEIAQKVNDIFKDRKEKGN